MNQASRIKIAKQLLHCARMILDASCHKQVKIAKSIIAYPSTDIKHLVEFFYAKTDIFNP